MFVEGFGEILVDILTVNPELSGVSSASSVLDTSNYTFHAVTFGKDAEGFNFHGHSVSTTQYVNDRPEDGIVSGYNLDRLALVNYASAAPFVSSYSPSSAHLHFSSTYNSVPIYPAPNHTRLELASTETTNASSFSATPPNLGHYPNAWVDSTLSNAWTIIGGFAPPSGAGKLYYITDSNGAYLASGVLNGMYNHLGLADKNGYVNVNQTSALAKTDVRANLINGPVIFSSLADSIHPASATVGLAIVPQRGDAVALAAYGGVTHFGVYCLDLNAMIASGISPPYSWDALNNNRIYKLVSKVTFWDNVLIHQDVVGVAGLEAGYNEGLLANRGPSYYLKFNFK